jgi:hypothetical protein
MRIRVTLVVLGLALALTFGAGFCFFRHVRGAKSLTPCAQALSQGLVDACTDRGGGRWLSTAKRQVASSDGTMVIHYNSSRSVYRLTCQDHRSVDLFSPWEYPGCDEGDACVFWAQNSAAIDLQEGAVMFSEARLRRLCGNDGGAGR